MSNLDFTAFQAVHGTWSNSVFPKECINSILLHMREEIDEIMADPEDIVEYADLFLLFMDASRRAGFNMDDIYFAARAKFLENQKKEWVPDENGVYHHVKTQEELAETIKENYNMEQNSKCTLPDCNIKTFMMEFEFRWSTHSSFKQVSALSEELAKEQLIENNPGIIKESITATEIK